VLNEIRIEALGAISVATAEFDRGLTVLTGETGTGKTMVVTGLHLLGGARADANRVRSGAERAQSRSLRRSRPWANESSARIVNPRKAAMPAKEPILSMMWSKVAEGYSAGLTISRHPPPARRSGRRPATPN